MVEKEFLNWLHAQYGSWVATLMTMQYGKGQSMRNTEYYKHWINAGRPSAEEARAKKAEGKAEEAPTPEDIEGMSPEEYTQYMQERYFNLEEEPHEPQEGFKWDILRADPQTGVPLQRPRWEQIPIEEKKGALNVTIEDISGWTSKVTRDTDGNIIDITPIERAGERERKAKQQEERDWRNLYAQQARGQQETETEYWKQHGQQAARETAAWASIMNPNAMRRGGDVQKGMSSVWENVRREILSGLEGQPRDWLKYGELAAKRNPYKGNAWGDTNQAISELGTYAKYYDWVAKDLERKAADPDDPMSKRDIEVDRQITEAEDARDEMLTQQKQMKQSKAKQTTGFEGMTGLSPSQVQRKQERQEYLGIGVKTPEWLPQFATGLQGRDYLPFGDLPQVSTPSPQSWATLPPTKREMWRGYAERAGQTPEDLEYQMGVMKPQPLRLGRQWTHRQRV